jgi:phage-related protein
LILLENASLKPLLWVGSSRKDLKRFPEDVQDVVGRALLDAQFGETPAVAKPLRGFAGASVLEIVGDFRGAETPKAELDLVRGRYRWAEKHYRYQDE